MDPRCRQVHSEVTRILRLDSSKEPSATARAAADRGAASATPGTTCAGLNGVGLTDLDQSKLARLQTLWSSRRVLASSSAASLNGSPAKGRGGAVVAAFLRDNSAAITEVGLTDVTADEMTALTEIWAARTRAAARAPK